MGEIPPRCDCGALLRPGVVWFGEALPEEAVTLAFEAAQAADVVLVIGTSSLVYPAAALPQAARAAGAFVVEINPEPTPLTPLADVSLRGTAAALVPAIVEGA
jgi:NAD-dependent deacetylase